MSNVVLQPEQEDLIQKCSDSMRRGNKSVLIQAATGFGKSYVASAILHRARKKNKKVWFTVPRRSLIKQMKETFSKFEISHTYIAAGLPLNPNSMAHICSTETIKKRLETIKAPDLAMIDETHYGGDGLGVIIDWLKESGTRIIGLSATPWLLSGQGLGCWYDDMVCGPSMRWLIDNKRLSEYRPFSPSSVDLSRLRVNNGDYVKADLSEKMEQDRYLIGNSVQHYKEHANGRLNIAYCVSVKHSEIMAQAFKDGGVTAAHVDGTTPDAELIKIIRAYANREIKVLTNCELLTFGFDLASQVGKDITIESMSDLRPTKSLALQMQKWGRVLRMKDYPALIFDHANNFQEHGLPCDDREWTLADRKQTRAGSRATPTKLCPKCFYCHSPAPVCPDCGFQYPIEERTLEEREGELLEIEISREKKIKRMEVGMAKTIEDLRIIAADRGYHHKWVARMASAKGIKK